ncbi:MAG: hypothetical protein RLZZ573_486 [Pseudomonadota bacterium]|jgi:hypothetical protein
MSTAIDHPADRMNRLVIKQAEQIQALQMQLQSLTWAAHLLLSLDAETPTSSVDLLILRNEVEAAEALLGGAK